VDETILVLIKFRLRGSLRFLSHAETLKVFQRGCVRAGIKIQYSQGFNPRPKLCLPLPRSVGVEVDDDLLCLRLSRDINGSQAEIDLSQIKARLSEQLPDGFELLSVSAGLASTEADSSFKKQGAKTLPQPITAMYVLPVQNQYINEELKSRIKRLLASKSLNLRRQTDPKKSKFKDVDVRPFLKSIELNNGNIVVECEISQAGSIRVDEILKLTELDAEKLAAPVRRTNVRWQNSE